MAEKEEIFATKIKYVGVCSFKDFYKFCYDWLSEEVGVDLGEKKYKETIIGNAKNIEIQWEGSKKITDYFKYIIKVEFMILGLQEVEVQKGNVKVKSNKGSMKVSIKGILVRDYNGDFSGSGFRKFLRESYDKWVIPSRIDQMEDKLASKCDEFGSQIKAYFDLEGKK